MRPGHRRRISMAEERRGAVTMRGNPLTLVGPELASGDAAPDVKLLTTALQEAGVVSKGKVRIVSVVPSLDTPVCDQQTRRFNEEAGKLPADVEIVCVSADLPFAAARWSQAAGADALEYLSDHREMAFGEAYGVRVKELRLDARAVFVIDRQGRLAHAQYVKEIAEPPDFEAALEAARRAAGS
jgi:thiol peroxidase